MRAILIVGALFLAGAFYNFFTPAGDTANGVGGLAYAVLLVGLWLFFRKLDRRNRKFLIWLSGNASAIRSGGSPYGSTTVTTETEITQYQAALSFVLITVKIPSGFYVVGQDSSRAIALVFTILCLTLGWWGIPWGPIYTIQAVIRNVKGGDKQKVADVLVAMQAN
ncbi:MAG: hypothetical protein HY533_01415 [Chloroflexi bacterium]|nr:hypothetical protein [Chloroflexota bacterium]